MNYFKSIVLFLAVWTGCFLGGYAYASTTLERYCNERMSAGRDPIIEVHGELMRCSNYVRKQNAKRKWEKQQKEIEDNLKKKREEQLRQDRLQHEKLEKERQERFQHEKLEKERQERLQLKQQEKLKKERLNLIEIEREKNKQLSRTASENSTVFEKKTGEDQINQNRVVAIAVIVLFLLIGAPVGIFIGIVNWAKSFNSVILKSKLK